MNTQDGNNEKKTSSFITRLRTIERQVGENVLSALETEASVAVLTTVVSGLRSDRVVSVPLSSDQVADISAILAQVQAEPEEPDEDSSTIGFHVILENEDPTVDNEG
jgi:hypothetical protein